MLRNRLKLNDDKTECISRIKQYLSPDALKMAVQALISHKLDYSNSLLIGLPKTELSKFQHIMDSGACMITGTNKFSHITPVLVDLHWLPVDYRVKFKLLWLTYKALHGLAPTYLSNLLQQYSSPRSPHSTEHKSLWLPLSLGQSASLNVFKANLKTYVFKLAHGAKLPENDYHY